MAIGADQSQVGKAGLCPTAEFAKRDFVMALDHPVAASAEAAGEVGSTSLADEIPAAERRFLLAPDGASIALARLMDANHEPTFVEFEVLI
jgi:hypothetical protein